MLDSYHIIIITASLLMIYGVSYLMVKSGKITFLIHKKIWNILLAVFFLISGLSGLLLALLIDYKLIVPGYRNLLWIHVEFGIAMALIALFHLIWHFRYYFPKK